MKREMGVLNDVFTYVWFSGTEFKCKVLGTFGGIIKLHGEIFEYRQLFKN